MSLGTVVVASPVATVALAYASTVVVTGEALSVESSLVRNAMPKNRAKMMTMAPTMRTVVLVVFWRLAAAS